jgi:DtxR family Mn-dependent transcriptional regulator
MDLIAHQQMNIGSKITVKKVFEFDESMEIIIDGKITKNISKQLANNIFIANDK